MEFINKPAEPLNPYSRLFLGSWLLATIAVSGFSVVDEPAYREQIEQWHRQRVQSLRSENGWLNVAGLFWLREGANTAGADAGNALAFPAGKAPDQLGTFRLTTGVVQFEPAPGAVVQANGEPVLTTTTIFAPELSKPLTLAHGSLHWFIIKRGSKYAVRLRDLESPSLSQFAGIARFAVDEAFRVKARLDKPALAQTIPILDVTGQTLQQPLAGTLVFELAGQPCRLDAVSEGGRLFIIFGDETNRHDTYGSGRFLYADVPGADGLTTLDFNQSINPPCAFTPYATCPLPPKQNRLAVRVPVGEKRYGDH